MRQFAAQNVREYFSVSMRMCWEAILRRYSIFVQNSKGTEVFESGVIVLGKAERMIRVEPTMISVATFL